MKRWRLVGVLTASMLLGQLVMGPGAEAHVLYSNICVWHDGTNAVKNRTEISDGRDYDGDGHGDGYTKVQATAKDNEVFNCDNNETVPINALAVDTIAYWWDGLNWNVCDEMGWKYNGTQTAKLTQYRYWHADCGSTYYFDYGGAYRLIGATWYGGWIIADTDESHWWS